MKNRRALRGANGDCKAFKGTLGDLEICLASQFPSKEASNAQHIPTLKLEQADVCNYFKRTRLLGTTSRSLSSLAAQAKPKLTHTNRLSESTGSPLKPSSWLLSYVSSPRVVQHLHAHNVVTGRIPSLKSQRAPLFSTEFEPSPPRILQSDARQTRSLNIRRSSHYLLPCWREQVNRSDVRHLE